MPNNAHPHLFPFSLEGFIAGHEGARRTWLTTAPFTGSGTDVEVHHETSRWHLAGEMRPRADDEFQLSLEAQPATADAPTASFGLKLTDPDWSTENYVLVPGAVYAGNRFQSNRYAYSPPLLGPSFADPERTPWINDLPRLSQGTEPSHLEQLSIDGSIPGLCIFFPKRKKALHLLLPQATESGPIGIEVIENEARDQAEILLSAPGIYHERSYTINGFVRSEQCLPDWPQDRRQRLELQLIWRDCWSIEQLFAQLFELRSVAFPQHPTLHNEFCFSSAWDLLHRKHNATNWRESMGLYQVNIHNDPPNANTLFQLGWCGGGITTLPMLQGADPRSVERACRNIDLIFEGQTDFGLFHPLYDGTAWRGNLKNESPQPGAPRREVERPWTLTRRAADALYFLSRQCLLLQERGQAARISEKWRQGLQRNFEALLGIWTRHRHFGQYLHLHTGEVMIAGSTSAALMPAALIVAGEFLKDPRGLKYALEIAADFTAGDLAAGVTTGGPGDCLQAPDSESVFALVESLVLVYEATSEAHWLAAAKSSAYQAASWVVPYDYAFPVGTALEQIGAKTRGSVMANAQNKHAAPGICTHSGEGLLRLYRASGDRQFLNLLRDIAHNIPQYISRSDKVIPTRLAWGREGLDHQPEGWICERINLTDWGEAIGEIAAYSCWCEAAMMLTWCDLPGVYWNLDNDEVCALDHVVASVEKVGQTRQLGIHNPTKFDATVKILAESSQARAHPLPVNAGAHFPSILVPAGQSIHWMP